MELVFVEKLVELVLFYCTKGENNTLGRVLDIFGERLSHRMAIGTARGKKENEGVLTVLGRQWKRFAALVGDGLDRCMFADFRTDMCKGKTGRQLGFDRFVRGFGFRF